jgi:4-hydroxybenzoate polyprenyltransferase
MEGKKVETLKKLFWTSRPISWINTAYPFGAAYLVTAHKVDATLVIGFVFFLIPYNLMMYGINDVYDYESDLKNPRKNSIEGALTDKSFHKTILLWSYLLPIPFILWFLTTNTAASNLIFLTSLFFVYAYSAPMLRFKEVAGVDSFTSAMHFSLPMAFALSITGWNTSYWLLMAAFVCWGMASHAFGAIQDIRPDRQAGIDSIATIFGARKTFLLTLGLYLLSGVLVALSSPAALPVALCALLYIGNIVKYFGITDDDAHTINTAWRRFIYINYVTGAIVTIALILNY